MYLRSTVPLRLGIILLPSSYPVLSLRSYLLWDVSAIPRFTVKPAAFRSTARFIVRELTQPGGLQCGASPALPSPLPLLSPSTPALIIVKF